MWYLVVVLLLFLLFQPTQRPALYPPGPPVLPFLGNIFSVWLNLKKYKYAHVLWQNWSKKYGNILGLRLGKLNVVVVSGKDFIKEVSTREVFDGRPDGFLYLLRSNGKKIGIIFSDGPAWNRSRRTVLKGLKTFGFNSSTMEISIKDECQELVNVLLESNGKPVTVNHMLNVSIVNILYKLVAGKRYDLNDEKLKTLCSLIDRAFKTSDMSGGILSFMPFLRYIIPDLVGYTNLKEVYKALHVFVEEIIEEHKLNVDIKNPKDLIDIFLIEMMEKKDDNDFTEEELKVICLDLLEAGVETVNNTAVFLFIHVLRNAEVQRRLQEEIDTEIGNSRRPILSDRSRMVYTEAVLLEALRISSVPAVGIPHMAKENAKLGDYVIPKGTVMLLALHDLHNGTYWKDPEEFRPERFITKEGNLKQDDWLMPFGNGKRRCPGEGLARSELFMFLTHILQQFTIKIPEGSTLPSIEPIDGITLSAREFQAVFEPRF